MPAASLLGFDAKQYCHPVVFSPAASHPQKSARPASTRTAHSASSPSVPAAQHVEQAGVNHAVWRHAAHLDTRGETHLRRLQGRRGRSGRGQ